MNKVKKIEELDLVLLLEIVESILRKEGYSELIKINSELALTKLKKGLAESTVGIFLTMKHLSGKIEDLCSLSDLISMYSKEHGFYDLILISSKVISKGNEAKIKDLLTLNVTFIGRDRLIQLIDKNLDNYWRHNDIELLEYERYYIDNISKDNELKSLTGFQKEAEKLLTIYIKPRLYKVEEDKESSHPQLIKYEESKMLDGSSPAIITGDTGAGKSTFLRKIGEKCILKDDEKRKRLPVFISAIDLIETNYELEKAINKNLNGFFNSDWEEAQETHNILLLVDSIDEFETEIQKKILDDLEVLFKKHSIQYFLATRSIETNQFQLSGKQLEYFQLEKFDSRQVFQFISQFFNNQSKAHDLIEALRDNRILERLPMTPLSISLISILFEEKNFEIPATISDIYDNFNILLLGKVTVKHRFEFVDITFKERILSVYALEILSNKNKIPFTQEKFISYFKDYFKRKSHKVPDDKIEEFLKFFISTGGVLFLKDKKYVQFKHDSFMEYYASLEIFKHQRNLQDKLVDFFYDMNWQNAAIFYAGQSKDMPEFLGKIIDKVESANNLIQYTFGVIGLGYLLQALYQTDNDLRKSAVVIALRKNVEAFDTYKKIASDNEIVPFKDLKLPLLSLINMFTFFENFNSATLREPLKMAFKEVMGKYLENPLNVTEGYKALKLALVLNSKRIGSEEELETLIFNSKMLSNDYLALLADMGVNLFKGDNYKELQKATKKALNSSNEIVIKRLLDTPANRIRFTSVDQITSEKKVRLFTEGKTDVEIIEHAFIVLTGGQNPYWSIKPTGSVEAGGATELRFMLEKGIPMIQEDEIVLGIFDNDQKGISEFNGLKSHLFEFVNGSKRLKKYKDKNVYALKLPMPYSRKNYYKENPSYCHFCIEHYFDDSILREMEMLEPTPINKVYSITKSLKKKTRFSNFIRTKHDASIFGNFICLFKEIDKIAGVEDIEYHEE